MTRLLEDYNKRIVPELQADAGSKERPFDSKAAENCCQHGCR